MTQRRWLYWPSRGGPTPFILYTVRTASAVELRVIQFPSNTDTLIASFDRYVTESQLYLDGSATINGPLTFSRSVASANGSTGLVSAAYFGNVDVDATVSFNGSGSVGGLGIGGGSASISFLSSAPSIMPINSFFEFATDGPESKTNNGSIALNVNPQQLFGNADSTAPIEGVVTGGSSSMTINVTYTPRQTSNPVWPVHFSTDGNNFYLGILSQPRVQWQGDFSYDGVNFTWANDVLPYLRGSEFSYVILAKDGSLISNSITLYPNPVILNDNDPFKAVIEASYVDHPYIYAPSANNNLRPYQGLITDDQEDQLHATAGGNRFGNTFLDGTYYSAASTINAYQTIRRRMFSVQSHDIPGFGFSGYPSDFSGGPGPAVGSSVTEDVLSRNGGTQAIGQITINSVVEAYQVYGFGYLP